MGIPQNITKMLGNYKKTAIVKVNKTLEFTSLEQDFIIETNLDFTPSLIILVLEGNILKRKINVISTYNYDYRTPVYETNDNYSRYIKDIKKESFTIATTSRQEDALILLEYIAIEQRGKKMNLKQNIDNTNELKNKVKLAKQKINETVVRGGYHF